MTSQFHAFDDMGSVYDNQQGAWRLVFTVYYISSSFEG